MPKRAAKFAKRARSQILYLDLSSVNDEKVEWRDILQRRMPCSMELKSHKSGIAMN